MSDLRDAALESSFAAVVTDPPYDLLSTGGRKGSPRVPGSGPFGRHREGNGRGFMGKAWDATGVAFEPATWSAMLRVTRPGGHLLAFGSPRTVHRMTSAIEDAGWEIRDTILWLYAQGMPKGPNLKPAWELIVLARRPGRGALRVDDPAVLLPYADEADVAATAAKNPGRDDKVSGRVSLHDGGGQQRVDPRGRHPANVMLTDPVLDGGYEGVVGGGGQYDQGGPRVLHDSGSRHLAFGFGPSERVIPGDSGGYSRIFLVPKASRREREEGLGGRDLAPLLWSSGADNPGSFQSSGTRRSSTNPHPTVKPVALMEHLVRLVAAPGERILDPFVGSGSTLVAAVYAGVQGVGIEFDPEYAEVAEWRETHARGLGLLEADS